MNEISIFRILATIGIAMCIGLIYLVDKRRKNKLELVIQRGAGVIAVVMLLAVNLPVMAHIYDAIVNTDNEVAYVYYEEEEENLEIDYEEEAEYEEYSYGENEEYEEYTYDEYQAVEYKVEGNNIEIENEIIATGGYIGIAPFNLIAPLDRTVIESGTLGTIQWEIDTLGTLWFGGGTFPLPAQLDNTPWRNTITRIVFTDYVDTDFRLNLFSNMSVLQEVENIHRLDVSNITIMESMFRNTSSLTSLDLSSWDVSNVTTMQTMFEGASSLTSLDVSSWNTTNVTTMLNMFSGASDLVSLDVSSWNTSNVTNMRNMFEGALSLTSLDVSTWQTGSVTTMERMFYRASSLTSLDVSNWNTGNVEAMSWMFYGASSIDNLDVSSWDTSNVEAMWGMFLGTSSLTSLDVSSWDTGNVQVMTLMFSAATGLTNLDVSNWNTSNVITMERMFWGADGLTHLDVSSWDTSSVTNTWGMFWNASSIDNLDVSNWDMSNVTNMRSMFAGATSITNLDVSSWDTGNVTNMESMFNATNVTTLDVSSWDTASVTNMASMFSNTSVTSLDLSNWDTSNVTNMAGMFWVASDLTSLDVSSWNTSNVTNMSSMFMAASSLERLDLSSWDTGNVTNMQHMFFGATSLRELTLAENFHFHGGIAVGIPDVPNNQYYTGFWQNVGTGTVSAPNGIYVWTSTELMNKYNVHGQTSQNTWVWQRLLHILGFDANGGTGSMDNASVGLNQTITLPASTFTRAGYTFTGWNTEADGSGVHFADLASYTHTVSGNVRLFAQWTQDVEDTYRVTFSVRNFVGGSLTLGGVTVQGNEIGEMTVEPGTRLTLESRAGVLYLSLGGTPFEGFIIAALYINGVSIVDDIEGLMIEDNMHIEIRFVEENMGDVKGEYQPAGNNNQGTGNAVSTADDTNIIMYIVIMIIPAALILGYIIFVILKKKRDK
ncbi:MAG: BspA family leucine-rich repeat surface protein [Oscillospiraceae bacterium]|nr:BspA family leucine-rich repeat surface protein [Oscillospiraceae bacterium]